MTADEVRALVILAVERVEDDLPISKEQAQALLSYCGALETAVLHLREENARLRAPLTVKTNPYLH